jgi:hypothetical protein
MNRPAIRKRELFCPGDAVIVLGFGETVPEISARIFNGNAVALTAFCGFVRKPEPAPDALLIGNGERLDVLGGEPTASDSILLTMALGKDGMFLRVVEGRDDDGCASYLILRSDTATINGLKSETEISAAAIRTVLSRLALQRKATN